MRAHLVHHLQTGQAIVLTHGLWRRSDRDAWRETVVTASGHTVLMYLPTSKEVDDFFARFEPPSDDEASITDNGDVEVIRSMAG